MFILIRALVYATFFIGFFLIAMPARLLAVVGSYRLPETWAGRK